MTLTLRPHQGEAADAVESAWRSGIKRPLIDACVASGKSLILAELARREIERGGRAVIAAHTRELVAQNANACRELMPGVHVGINAAALGERCWRAPVISCAIQSVYKYANRFGPVTQMLGDEAHLWPHSESGMYREFVRGIGVLAGQVRVAGASGTVFRLQGGSLIEGEGAPFDAVVYRYSILDGIRDGYLCPAFSVTAEDKVDASRLRTRQGEFTAESSDAQMIAAMDNHIAQMVQHGAARRAWLVFEAGTKSASAMAERMNGSPWNIPTGLVLGETPAGERANTIAAYRSGRLRALVNVNALTTGFDVPHVDMLVMRRPTKSLGLYIQQVGRGLRCVGGTIETSRASGKFDCIVLDFAGNIDRHGPLDFIRVKETVARLVSCETCGKRNAQAAARCWSCNSLMTKLCPACLENIAKWHLDCPHCSHDMRRPESAEEKAAKLRETPSGAALIASYKTGVARAGGWQPVRFAYEAGGCHILADMNGEKWTLPASIAAHAAVARWVRPSDTPGLAGAILVPNGSARTSVKQISADGLEIIVPMPAASASAEQPAP